jgi:hypothetical protein
MSMDNPVWIRIQGMLIAAVAIAILIVVPIFVIRMRRRMYGHVARNAPEALPLGTVRFYFHKYSGFLVFVRQYRYDKVLPIQDAQALMGTIIRHNLTWGLFAYGGPFVPIFTFFEWRAQKKRLASAQQGFPVAITKN